MGQDLNQDLPASTEGGDCLPDCFPRSPEHPHPAAHVPSHAKRREGGTPGCPGTSESCDNGLLPTWSELGVLSVSVNLWCVHIVGGIAEFHALSREMTVVSGSGAKAIKNESGSRQVHPKCRNNRTNLLLSHGDLPSEETDRRQRINIQHFKTN